MQHPLHVLSATRFLDWVTYGTPGQLLRSWRNGKLSDAGAQRAAGFLGSVLWSPPLWKVMILLTCMSLSTLRMMVEIVILRQVLVIFFVCVQHSAFFPCVHNYLYPACSPHPLCRKHVVQRCPFLSSSTLSTDTLTAGKAAWRMWFGSPLLTAAIRWQLDILPSVTAITIQMVDHDFWGIRKCKSIRYACKAKVEQRSLRKEFLDLQIILTVNTLSTYKNIMQCYLYVNIWKEWVAKNLLNSNCSHCS